MKKVLWLINTLPRHEGVLESESETVSIEVKNRFRPKGGGGVSNFKMYQKRGEGGGGGGHYVIYYICFIGSRILRVTRNREYRIIIRIFLPEPRVFFVCKTAIALSMIRTYVSDGTHPSY